MFLPNEPPYQQCHPAIPNPHLFLPTLALTAALKIPIVTSRSTANAFSLAFSTTSSSIPPPPPSPTPCTTLFLLPSPKTTCHSPTSRSTTTPAQILACAPTFT